MTFRLTYNKARWQTGLKKQALTELNASWPSCPSRHIASKKKSTSKAWNTCFFNIMSYTQILSEVALFPKMYTQKHTQAYVLTNWVWVRIMYTNLTKRPADSFCSPQCLFIIVFFFFLLLCFSCLFVKNICWLMVCLHQPGPPSSIPAYWFKPKLAATVETCRRVQINSFWQSANRSVRFCPFIPCEVCCACSEKHLVHLHIPDYPCFNATFQAPDTEVYCIVWSKKLGSKGILEMVQEIETQCTEKLQYLLIKW